jgi:hypothetical protein
VLELRQREVDRQIELAATRRRRPEAGVDLGLVAARGIEARAKTERVRLEQRRHVAWIERLRDGEQLGRLAEVAKRQRRLDCLDQA